MVIIYDLDKIMIRVKISSFLPSAIYYTGGNKLLYSDGSDVDDKSIIDYFYGVGGCFFSRISIE